MSDNKKVCELLILSKMLSDNYQNLINSVSSNFGLNFGEASTLLFFYDNPDCINAKDFRCNHHVSKAYVSKSINSLLEKKLIDLRIDNNDKRYQKIIINEDTLNIINELKSARIDFKKSILHEINESDLIVFFDVLSNIKKNIINMEEGK